MYKHVYLIEKVHYFHLLFPTHTRKEIFKAFIYSGIFTWEFCLLVVGGDGYLYSQKQANIVNLPRVRANLQVLNILNSNSISFI